MNKVELIGNLTRDPDLKHTQGDVAYCLFTLAVNRDFSGRDGEKKVDYIPCTAWRAKAEAIKKYVSKGDKVGITGSLEIEAYEDNEGNKKQKVNINVDTVDFLSTKRNSATDGAYSQETPTGNVDSLVQIDDDDDDYPF